MLKDIFIKIFSTLHLYSQFYLFSNIETKESARLWRTAKATSSPQRLPFYSLSAASQMALRTVD